jgi:hypothetical protein
MLDSCPRLQVCRWQKQPELQHWAATGLVHGLFVTLEDQAGHARYQAATQVGQKLW